MARWPFAGLRLYSLSGPRFHLHVLLWEVTVNKTLRVLSVGLLLGADDADKDYARFEGTWMMVSGEENGKQLDQAFLQRSRLDVKGKEHTVVLGMQAQRATHKFDSTKNPKQMDIKRVDGMEFEAIYKLDDDTFTICLHEKGKPRPKEFSGKAGTDQKLHVWKRAKQ